MAFVVPKLKERQSASSSTGAGHGHTDTATLDHSELMARMRPVRIPQRLPVVLSKAEVGRLIAARSNLKHQTALSLAYGTELRARCSPLMNNRSSGTTPRCRQTGPTDWKSAVRAEVPPSIHGRGACRSAFGAPIGKRRAQALPFGFAAG